ncbi:MAG TPA: hypothetical protein V6D30_15550 [Leptolyngbyaceae cyanobacterium]
MNKEVQEFRRKEGRSFFEVFCNSEVKHFQLGEGCDRFWQFCQLVVEEDKLLNKAPLGMTSN